MPNTERLLRETYERREPLLLQLARTLELKTTEALSGLPHIDRIAFRVKSPASFVTKASSPRYNNPLSEIEDQVAGRVVTFFRDDISIVRQRIAEYFVGVEHEAKEPESASEFGYESDHYVFVISEHWKPDGWSDQENMPNTVEFQIRTLFMHAWAEPQHDLGYKGTLDKTTLRELSWVAASAWGADHKLNELARRASASGRI